MNVVQRKHRLAVAKCEGYAHLVHPEQHWAVVFVETGGPPGLNERWHALAQAMADFEAEGAANEKDGLRTAWREGYGAGWTDNDYSGNSDYKATQSPYEGDQNV